jgi:hypothetical protein
MHDGAFHGAKAKREKKVEAEKNDAEQNRGLAEILPVRSIQNSTPTFSLLSLTHHNHGSSTNNAATGLLEILAQDQGGHPTSTRSPIPLNRLLPAPPARPSPSESPRAIPITSPSSHAP